MIITIHGYRQEGKSTTAVLIRNFLRMFGFTAEVKEATLQMQAHFDYMAQRFHGTRWRLATSRSGPRTATRPWRRTSTSRPRSRGWRARSGSWSWRGTVSRAA